MIRGENLADFVFGNDFLDQFQKHDSWKKKFDKFYDTKMKDTSKRIKI